MQYIELVRYNDEFILDHIDEAYFSDELSFSPDNDANIASAIQNAFTEISAKHRVKSKFLFVSMPAQAFHILRLPFDHTLLEPDLLLQFRWDLSILYPHINADEFSIQYYEIENPASPLPKYAVVGVIHRKFLRLLRAFSQKNGFTLSAVDYSHFGSDCCLLLNYQTAREGVNLSVFLEEQTLSFEILSGGKPVFMQIRKFESYNELSTLILAQIEEAKKFRVPVNEINSAFIFGDLVTPVLVETLEKNIGIPCFPVNPFKKLTISSKLSSSQLLREQFFTFSSAAGICYRLG